MWHAFFDSSALVKHYSTEDGTPLVNAIFQRVPLFRMSCSMLTILEVTSILVRKRNDGRMTDKMLRAALDELEHEITKNEDFVAVSVDDALLLSAIDFIAKHNLNASDCVILRAALFYRDILQKTGDDLLFWASDARLLRAAEREGLTVFDPEIDTLLKLDNLLDATNS
jgi:uncharacterized protein